VLDVAWCAFDVPLCGGTAPDVRAGLFTGTNRNWVNGQNSIFEEQVVWRKIYFSHRPTAFTAWLLVDSHSLLPYTPTHTQKPWLAFDDVLS
jgi:hypothetical protein